MIFNMDADPRNANWLRSMRWKIPAQTLPELLAYLGAEDLPIDEQVKAVESFMKSVSAEGAPEFLKQQTRELFELMKQLRELTTSDAKQKYDSWIREHFSCARSSSEDSKPSTYSYVRQSGQLVKIPTDITDFERGVLALVQDAQRIIDKLDRNFTLIFKPISDDDSILYPELEIRIDDVLVTSLILQPKDEKSREVCWRYYDLPTCTESFEKKFTFRDFPLSIVMIAAAAASVTREHSFITDKHRYSPAIDEYVRFAHGVYGYAEDAPDKQTQELCDEVVNFMTDAYYLSRLQMESEPDWLDGPDDDEVCSKDGECKQQCSYCEDLRHEEGTCGRDCFYCGDERRNK